MASDGSTFNMDLFNNTNGTEEFSCSMSGLSKSVVTDHPFWTINQDFLFGIPLVAVFKLIVFLLVFTTNVFLIMIFITTKRFRHNFFRPLQLSLGIAGLSNSLTVLLFGVAIEMSQGAEFVYGSSDATRCGVCTFAGVLFILFNTVSLHTLATFAIVRFALFVVVFHNLKVNHVRAIIVLIWFISFWIAIPPAMGFGLYEFDRDFGACIPRLTGNSKTGVENRAYVAFVLLEALIPLCITIFTNFTSCWAVLQHTVRDKNEMKKLTRMQERTEAFLAFWIANVLWVPIIIITLVIVSTSPETFSRQLYIICWLLYLCTPMFQIAEIMRFLRLNF